MRESSVVLRGKVLWPLVLMAGLAWLGMPQGSAEAACATTRVYLLLDTSGSMKGSKHNDVRTAIRNLTNSYKNVLEFGLATFGEKYQHRVAISATGWQTIYNSVNSYPSNENYTRMGTAIRAAGQYIWGLKQAEPAATKNRPYYLVLITDGYPTGENLSASGETRSIWKNYGIKTFVIGIQFNASVLNSIAKEGQTSQPYNATNQSSLNAAFNSIANKASAEVCDGLDNDCDGQVDEGLTRSCSDACGTGTQSCVSARWTACSSSANAKPEICDGLDNDCDGKVDEDWPNKGQKCSVGTGSCKGSSTWQCRPDKSGVYCPIQSGNPQPETCNGRDDDCDGLVDEGLKKNCSSACGNGTQTCFIGIWLACSAPQPKPELCNGKDDNCNGQTDEDWPLLGTQCSQGGGNCAKVGTWRCDSSGAGITCAASSPNGKPELCDGIDNDCDGQVDEDYPNKGKACGGGTGGCKAAGTQVCKPDGSGTQCSTSGGTPSPEVCDGKDNDCDGDVDEGLKRACKSNCGAGVEECKGGRWVNCNAPKAIPETCDAKDNDCDGQIDNGLRRKCSSKCGDGLETCVAGRWSYCDAPEPKKESCNGKDSDCNGKVDDVPPKDCKADCGKGQSVCQKGVWLECKGPPPSKEVCDGLDNDCDGQTDEDLSQACKSKCGSGTETCKNGRWVNCDAQKPSLDICDGADNDCDGKTDNGAKCPPGAVCKYGRCFIKCRNGECPSGSFCETDLCNGNLCEKVKCPSGKACVVGRCVDLCELGTCPQGQRCENGQCIDPNNPNPGENNGGSENPSSGEQNNPGDGGTHSPDGAPPQDGDTGSDTSPTADDPTGLNPDEKTSGRNNPPGSEGRRRAGTGCVCHSSSFSAPQLPTLAFFLFALAIAVRRRRK